ncbi:DUF2165 domain-containing protein [Paenibacillus sp. chi10]|uniref:DUF2165 domain-containing protein n=1 Tax=Paenibacillus suaedae TaxID=3077233 RepID=A0AAJ2JRU3_9BACL|nr:MULTISPECIES: DUF2165 domain-containing protein [unclassified Paenibacillus]MDT8975858.1 DUF2165 domain-containing protein [Paenibacillus sp. chi10]GAV10896.1 small integral membrane protein [Paenibacillus sp. NAIST15-1]
MNLSTGVLIRFTKALAVMFFGLYVFLVAFGNITDYNTNFQFVKHVLSMDTTFPDNNIMYRAITGTTIHHIGYIAIIITEAAVAFICIWGSLRLFSHLHADAESFHKAKNLSIAGLILGLCVWFLGFQVIGGEWFGMWMSSEWNGLFPADRLTTFMMGVLIFLTMKNDEVN